ncbi:MAG: hypothetical protein EI684_04805 [Candidatus Viridilinea halotolerans]|uniref:Uncharacterized protein n=1 Tax=Candidatus Viridilinea halotolerans TaxID=2491704 RepID=A0A426U612_9CHLR|nr:MAG: hypothetical protein EI684_04805 [Candidatus Viridilinea halotolerans]
MHPKWVWRGDLFAHPLEIWNHVGREPQASDVYVLYAIASQHDLYTDGHGWYWVGQAMLKVAASGKKISVPRLVKILMDDWHDNDNYGDDSDQRQREPLLLGNGQPRAAFEKTLDLSLRPEALETDSAPMTNGATEETSPGEATAAPRSHETNSNGSEHRAQRNGAAEHTTRPSPAPRDSSKLLAHPACQAYLEAFDTTLNLEQINRITETVHDLVLWRKVLADWQANGWREQSVLKMLDRYTKEVDAANPHEDMESIIWIQCHPDLDIDERVKWSHRFRAATASSERRAIIAELLKKHPTRREDLLL